MVVETTLSELSDVQFLSILKAKEKERSWSIGEMIEIDRRGDNFLTLDSELKDAVVEVRAKLTKNISDAIAPSLAGLQGQVDFTRKMSEQFQGIGKYLRSAVEATAIINSQSNAIRTISDAAKINIGPEIAKSLNIGAGAVAIINARSNAIQAIADAAKINIGPEIAKSLNIGAAAVALIDSRSSAVQAIADAAKINIGPEIAKTLNIGAEAAARIQIQSESIQKFMDVVKIDGDSEIGKQFLKDSPKYNDLISATQKTIGLSLAKTYFTSTPIIDRASDSIGAHLDLQRQADIYRGLSERLSDTEIEVRKELREERLPLPEEASSLDLIASDPSAPLVLTASLIQSIQSREGIFALLATQEVEGIAEGLTADVGTTIRKVGGFFVPWKSFFWALGFVVIGGFIATLVIFRN